MFFPFFLRYSEVPNASIPGLPISSIVRIRCAAGHHLQPGITCSRASPAAGHHLQSGITCSRASPAAGHHLQPGITCSRASPAAGHHLQPGITCSRASPANKKTPNTMCSAFRVVPSFCWDQSRIWTKPLAIAWSRISVLPDFSRKPQMRPNPPDVLPGSRNRRSVSSPS